MPKEYRIYGPPGTGKTTALATKYVPAAIKKFGSNKVMILSFTRAAAREIATKRSLETGLAIDINSKMVGTVHQICFHALGTPKIAETLHQLWNDQNPRQCLSTKTSAAMENIQKAEQYSSNQDGDKMLRALNIKRNKMESVKLWQPSLLHFKKKWDTFKKETESMDFTDLIETALTDLPYAPNRPSVIFIDEAQDSTPLQLALIRSWGEQAEWIVLVGDDQQCLYRFSGATPRAMMYPEIDEKMITVLNQSYRLPQKVLDRAQVISEQMIEKFPKKFAARKDWLQDTVEGSVKDIDATYKKPKPIIDYAEQKFKENKSVMILASCAYMLEAVKHHLKLRGLPFGNRYRLIQTDWNPLASSTTRGTSAKDLLVAFVSNGIDENFWNIPQFITWTKYIKVCDTGLRRNIGNKGINTLQTAIENREPGLHTARNVYNKILTETGAQQALARNLSWFKENLKASRQNTIDYPIKVYETWGIDALDAPVPPRRNEAGICIGTVHSVKGGESNCVILFPDISFEAENEMKYSSEGKDSVLRTFYVGMTRAYEELVLARPAMMPTSRKQPQLYVKL